MTEGLQAGRLEFTTDTPAAVAGAEFVYLCVPTPQGLDGSADLTYLEAAAAEIAPHLPADAVVVNKSTVPVGSTRRVEQALGRTDVFVVSNPEFLREGSAVHDFLNPDRVVIGSDDQGAAIRVASLYLGVPAPAHGHRSGVGRDHQVRLQRLPGHEALVRQRRGRGVRGGRRRRQRRRAGDGLRQAHRQRVPPARSGLRGVVLPEGHPGPALRIAEDAGYDFEPARRRPRGQRRAVRPGHRQDRRGWPAVARRGRHRRVGAHLQGQHRRSARVAGRRDHPAADRRRGRASGPTTRPSTGSAARAAGHRRCATTPTPPATGRRCWPC